MAEPARPLFEDDSEADRAAEIPWTLDQGIALFLNRWCHRAVGDRSVAEQELRQLIAEAKARPWGAGTT